MVQAVVLTRLAPLVLHFIVVGTVGGKLREVQSFFPGTGGQRLPRTLAQRTVYIIRRLRDNAPAGVCPIVSSPVKKKMRTRGWKSRRPVYGRVDLTLHRLSSLTPQNNYAPLDVKKKIRIKKAYGQTRTRTALDG
jgi:hypothetical protein